MYAVFQSGGKQHRVSEGQTVRLEKLDIATGETVEFAEVLMIANGEEVKIGVPFVDGGVIKAERRRDNLINAAIIGGIGYGSYRLGRHHHWW